MASRTLALCGALGAIAACSCSSARHVAGVPLTGGRHAAGDPTISAIMADSLAPFPVRRLADGIYLVPGDTGQASEGRPNAGFILTLDGVIVVDALASPRQGERLIKTIRATTALPIRWLILTHHHPDHHFGAVTLRRIGAKLIAHPDRTTLAGEQGDSALARVWSELVGGEAMRGFAFANVPDVPVARDTMLRIGGRTIALLAQGLAHTPGDLVVWLPDERVMFAGDILVEDGVTMVVDGDSGVLLHVLARMEALDTHIIVPGHGVIPETSQALIHLTRCYLLRLRMEMRQAVTGGIPLNRVLARMTPADDRRPVSRASRERRNAVRVYLEMERELVHLGSSESSSTKLPEQLAACA